MSSFVVFVDDDDKTNVATAGGANIFLSERTNERTGMRVLLNGFARCKKAFDKVSQKLSFR